MEVLAMKNKLIPTRYDNPCPICAKTNGNCRITNELILCMSFAGTIESHVNGYKNIGDTTDHNWAKFIPNTGSYTSEKKKQYKQFKEAEEQAKLERFKGSLTIEERDKNIRAISEYLGLSEKDHQHLKERGLSDEEIKKGYFCTVKPFSELPDTISTRLAGIYIGRNGQPHIGSEFQQGILCPSFNQNGLITGYQIRRESKNNKYIWGVTREKADRPKISSHLPNGELPITVFRNQENKQGFLCDGLLKSKIANSKHNINIGGASGGNFLSSQNQYLELLENGHDVYILDGGDILNRQVIKRLKRLADWTRENTKHELKFAWYRQVEKNNNDIDEIDKFEYDLLTIEELLELAKDTQFLKRKFEQLSKVKKFNPKIKINERYVNDYLIKLDINNIILGIKSPMNTGKSYYLNCLVNSLDERFILIGNRRVLTKKLSNNLALEYISLGKHRDDAIKAFERATDSEIIAENGIAIVIDSLLKLEGTNYEDAVIIIDEANQLIEALFLSNTYIKSVRGRVIRLLADIISKAKSVILCDANLSDHTVNFFASLNKGLEVVKIENEYQENDIKLFSYPSQEGIKSELESRLADNQNLFLVSDSAKDLTAIDDLIKSNHKSVLLTQNNLADHPKLHRFLDENGIKIKDENIQCLFLSPVGQSGISIEIDGHFDAVFGLFFGVVGTETARQLLRRLRDKCERHIWIADRGIGYTTDYDPQEIIKLQNFKTEQVTIGSQLFSDENDTYKEMIIKQYQAIIEGKDQLRKLSETAAAELIAKNNIEKSDYKEILIDELKTEGYQVTEIEEENYYYDDLFYQAVKTQKTVNDCLILFYNHFFISIILITK